MAKKEFTYRGKSLEELQALSVKELAPLLQSSARRKIKRGFTDQEQQFIINVQVSQKPVRTHCRDMIILPSMFDKRIKIHTGNNFEEIIIQPEMIGHRLGEFALSRKRVKHTVSGIGSKKKGKVR